MQSTVTVERVVQKKKGVHERHCGGVGELGPEKG